MLKNERHSEIFVIIYLLFFELGGTSGHSCPYTENFYGDNNEEFSPTDGQNFQTKEFEFHRVDENFDPSSQSEGISFDDFSIENRSQHRLTNRTSGYRRGIKKAPKIVSNLYRTVFDRRYLSNYSQIFQTPREGRLLKYFKTGKLSNYRYASFPSLYEIYKYLEVLENSGKGRASIVPLKIHNGSWNTVNTNFDNKILSIRISSRTELRANEENLIIVVVAGIHGRDWYAIQSAIFLATELINNENRTREREFDWWIIPVLNPDGYEFSQSDSKWRNWSKNLHGTQNIDRKKCFGIDLDRNFEFQCLACQETLCHPNFPGTVPFSSPEARGLRDTLEAFSDSLDCFVALKEGRQMLVYPFSDTLQSPMRVGDFEKISSRGIEAFGKHVDGFYEHGQSSVLINISAGFIEDWAKVHLGIDKSFAFYLGPTNKDRRDLKSQHLKDHMYGTLELLKVIAHGRTHEKRAKSLSARHVPLFSFVINLSLLHWRIK